MKSETAPTTHALLAVAVVVAIVAAFAAGMEFSSLIFEHTRETAIPCQNVGAR